MSASHLILSYSVYRVWAILHRARYSRTENLTHKVLWCDCFGFSVERDFKHPGNNEWAILRFRRILESTTLSGKELVVLGGVGSESHLESRDAHCYYPLDRAVQQRFPKRRRPSLAEATAMAKDLPSLPLVSPRTIVPASVCIGHV